MFLNSSFDAFYTRSHACYCDDTIEELGLHLKLWYCIIYETVEGTSQSLGPEFLRVLRRHL